MSDQNEGLYDSVSAPADLPQQTSSASPEAIASAASTNATRGAARAADDEETTALDEVITDGAETASDGTETTQTLDVSEETRLLEPEGDETQVFDLSEEDEAEPTALLGTTAEAVPADRGTPSGGEPVTDETAAVGAVEETVVEDTAVDEAVSERAAREAEVRAQQAEAAARARQRAERDRRLGTVAPAAAAPAAATAPTGKNRKRHKRTTDRFAGSLGLFLLRVVGAVVVGVFGFQIISESEPVINALQGVGVPQADMVSTGVGVLALVIAVMILFGLGTRIASVLLVALAAATLALFRWGRFNPFVTGQAGFSGDMEFLLAGIGLCLLFLGAGGWSIDAGLRHSRARRKTRAQATN